MDLSGFFESTKGGFTTPQVISRVEQRFTDRPRLGIGSVAQTNYQNYHPSILPAPVHAKQQAQEHAL